MAAVEETEEAIRSVPAPAIVKEIPFELVRHHERKTTKLLTSSNSTKPIAGRHKAIEFAFTDALFVHQIIINTTGYVANDFDVEWTNVDGSISQSRAKKNGDSYSLEVNRLVSAIRFTPARTYFSDPLVNSVQIFGFHSSEIPSLIDYARDVTALADELVEELESENADIAKRRSELEALQATRGSLSQDIAKFKSQSSTEQSKIKRLGIQQTELITKNGELERSISDLESRLESNKQDVSRYSQTRNSLVKSIENKKKTLAALEANINLFPSEIAGFADQGSTNVQLYTRIAALPIFIIAVLFVFLISGAADLTTKIVYTRDLNIPALLVSRAPYVAISITIITVCYYLARMFVLEIIRVNRQKLSLTKISVVSKDDSYSLEDGLSLTDNEKYERRLRLKMDLMRDHLKDYITKDFEPSLPSTIASSLSTGGDEEK